MFRIFTHNFRHETTGINESFKVMTFNVDMTENVTHERCVNLLNLIELEKPDILCLQEVSPEAFGFLKEDLDSNFEYSVEDPIRNETLRFCIYSKFKIESFNRHCCVGGIDTVGFSKDDLEAIDLFRKQMSTYSANIKINGQDVCIYSSHFHSSAYSTARRSMTEDENWLSGLPIYYHNYETGKRIRDYEAINTRRFIDESINEGKAVIVAGDLNDWCGSDCLDTLLGSDLKDAWWEGGNGFGWTYLGWNLRLRLDHILYSENFELINVKVIDSNLSDHKPLIAKFVLK